MTSSKIESQHGRLPSIHKRGEQPLWVAEAAQRYSGAMSRPEGETNFLRGNGSIEILNRILPELRHQPNILLVGLGIAAEPLKCCYEPFRIAAHLEGMNTDYRMTLVDVNPEVITDVSNRTRLFLATRQYGGQLRAKLEGAWEKYIEDTRQTSAVIFKRQEELVFYDYLEVGEDDFSFKYYLNNGIFAASVSQEFRTKLANGEIRLVLSDIAVADLGNSELFDFVECTNVLYLLTTEGQQLAFANIAQSIAGGGRLLINDIGGYTGTPVFERLGGWLDEKKLGQLGLEIEEIMQKRETSQKVLLKKVG